MNCRAIILVLTLIVLTIPFKIRSQTLGIEWQRFQSENIKIQDTSSGEGDVRSTYPLFMQTIYTRLLDWEPRVKSVTAQDEELCRLSFSSSSLKERVLELGQFQKEKADCVYRKDAASASTVRKLFQALSVNFDVSDSTHFRKVIFQLPAKNGQAIFARGLFGFHDDKKARPLMILRLGVHGNIDELLAERFIAKAAYEDFDFNFLVLENLTSHGYLSQDNPITFAGIEEGLHTFYILKQLKEENAALSALITKIHLIGISLGGHGIFVTTTLDEKNNKYLSSASAYCPMINLKETMDSHSNEGAAEAGIDLWNHLRLAAIPNRILELNHTEWWKTAFDFQPRFMPAILDYLAARQFAPSIKLPENIKWPKGFKQHLENSKSFFELNNFWPYYENKITPFLIVTTPNDPLVPLDSNSNLIVQKKQPGVFSKTQILQLDRSIHCALPTEYQWSFVIDLMKAQWL
ncbi:MAG: hypothetical protein WA160_11235 [Pseudobdellovibrio sp.]